MKKILIATSLLASLVSANDAELFKKCAGCHGLNGERAALGKSIIIKDMSRSDFISAMNGYKDGSYGREMKDLMTVQVMPLSTADIEVLASIVIK